MTAKQVKVASSNSSAPISPKAKIEDTSDAAPATNDRARNLFIKVDTFDTEGKTIGTRLVDLYHFGTRNWLQNHHWWAMHNGHTVETQTANEEEVEMYLEEQKLALAAKYSHCAA